MSKETLINLALNVEFGANKQMQREYIETLMGLIEGFKPDHYIEFGTYTGTSALAAVSAMHLLGRPENSVTTVDIKHGLFRKTEKHFHAPFLKEGIDILKINDVEQNFKDLEPSFFLYPENGQRVVIFYDIHDLDDKTQTPCSPVFINEWIPLIKDGIVAVHDTNPCDEDWERPAHWGTVPSKAIVKLWTGQWFRGFGEVEHFINLLNEHKVDPRVVLGTSIIWFYVKEGVPQ